MVRHDRVRDKELDDRERDLRLVIGAALGAFAYQFVRTLATPKGGAGPGG